MRAAINAALVSERFPVPPALRVTLQTEMGDDLLGARHGPA